LGFAHTKILRLLSVIPFYWLELSVQLRQNAITIEVFVVALGLL
jgi:hypothetical protein